MDTARGQAHGATTTAAHPHEPAYGWVVVWGSFASLLVIFGVAYSFAAFFQSFAHEFEARRADVAAVFGLCGLIYFLLGPVGGMLADRHGPRAVCSAGMIVIATGLLLASFAQSMAMVYVAYGIGVGLGVALVYTPSIGSVQPWFTRRRGLAAGIASSGIGAGTLVLPLLAAAAIDAFGWRGAMRAIALGVLVVGLVATGVLRRAPVPAGAAGVRPGKTLAEALRDRRFWWFFAFTLLSAPAMFIPFAHVSAAARDLGIDEARAVGLVGLIGVGSLCGRFAIGALADRLGRTVTLALMQASMAVSYGLWYVAHDYPAFVAYAIWFGLSYGGIVSLMPAICMDMFGARAVASIVGTLYSAAAFGNLLGPVAAGAVFDRFGSYAPVIAGCVVFSTLATMAASRLVRRHAPAY
ncbi:MAG TPA: MFS transporter [Caldimonas sp.]|nr:MFS transporter [Caldimonas sp.]